MNKKQSMQRRCKYWIGAAICLFMLSVPVDVHSTSYGPVFSMDTGGSTTTSCSFGSEALTISALLDRSEFNEIDNDPFSLHEIEEISLALNTPEDDAFSWRSIDFNQVLLNSSVSSSKSAAVCFTASGSLFLIQNESSFSLTSWTSPIAIASDVTTLSQPQISQAGSIYEIFITWINSSGVLMGRGYNTNTRTLESAVILFDSAVVDDYDISSNGEDWAVALHTTGEEIYALNGTRTSLTKTTQIALEGVDPNVAISSTKNAVIVFAHDTGSQRRLGIARYVNSLSSWELRYDFYTAVLEPTPQVVIGTNDAYIIGSRVYAGERVSLLSGQPNVTVIEALLFNNFNSSEGISQIASRLDENVETFTLTSNTTGLAALSYRSLKRTLPQYQMTVNLQNGQGKLGLFTAPKLLSEGDSSIGLHTHAAGPGRMATGAYHSRSGNTMISTFGYIPGNGPRGGVNSRYQNYSSGSSAEIENLHMNMGHTFILIVWTHEGVLHVQSGSVPYGY